MSPPIPADLGAEQAVLGACLLSVAAIDAVVEILTIEDFYKPEHQRIYETVVRLHALGLNVDSVAVADEIRRSGFEPSPDYLLELQSNTPSLSNAARHAMIVIDAALRRRLIHVGSEIVALGYGQTPTADAQEAVDRSRALLSGLHLPINVGQPDGNVDAFISATPIGYDWLVPGFLEYRDRMIVTGLEGHGKSTLLTQIAFCVAAGLHPWTLNLTEARTVLLIDCENSHRLVNRRLIGLRSKAKFMDPNRLIPISRPEGLDLTTRADLNWLLDRVLANKAELLVIGPHYHLSRGTARAGDVGGEDRAISIADALNTVRNRGNCAVILEAHAPHGPTGNRELRPFGSTVWMRWPEFGIGIRQIPESAADYSLEHWRPPRDQRIWPPILARGGEWPWNPTWPPGMRPSSDQLGL